MNAIDIVVLLLLAAAVALVIRRNLRKGVPCEGGGTCHGACASCRRGRRGGCHAARAAALLASRREVKP